MPVAAPGDLLPRSVLSSVRVAMLRAIRMISLTALPEGHGFQPKLYGFGLLFEQK
jgi:hypothetical protein